MWTKKYTYIPTDTTELYVVPLGSPDPVLHSQQLNVRCLAGNLSGYRWWDFWRFCGAKEIVQESISIREGEKDGAVVFTALSGHCEGVIGQFIVTSRVRRDGDRVWSRPLLSIHDWSQTPCSAGPVVDGQLSTLLAAHISGEM